MALAISYISVSAVQASIVSWDIQFFDATDIQVGNGSMSYDPDTTYTYSYPTHDEFTCFPPDYLSCGFIPAESTYETNYSFSSFDFNILDANWSVSFEGTQWWNGSANYYLIGKNLPPRTENALRLNLKGISTKYLTSEESKIFTLFHSQKPF